MGKLRELTDIETSTVILMLRFYENNETNNLAEKFLNYLF